MDDDPSPMSPEESLNLIAREQEKVQRQIGFAPLRLLLAWGIAWLVGFGLEYLAVRGVVSVVLATVVTVVLFVAAVATSTVYGVRAGRGVRGPSRTQGALYGWTWPLGYIALSVINGRLGDYLSESALSLLWSGSALLLTGVLYLAAGAMFADRLQYGLGGWMLASAAVSVAVGYPANFLVLAFAGGGGFIVAGAGYVVLARYGRTDWIRPGC